MATIDNRTNEIETTNQLLNLKVFIGFTIFLLCYYIYIKVCRSMWFYYSNQVFMYSTMSEQISCVYLICKAFLYMLKVIYHPLYGMNN